MLEEKFTKNINVQHILQRNMFVWRLFGCKFYKREEEYISRQHINGVNMHSLTELTCVY